MRISERLRFSQPLASIRQVQQRLIRAEQEVSTGLRVRSPGDDPAAAAGATRSRALLSRLEGYSEHADRAKLLLGQGEQALGAATEVLEQLIEQTIQAASDTLNAEDRRIIAGQVAQARAELLQLANRQVDGSWIFAGTRTDQPAFDASGVFQGNSGTVGLQLGEQLELPVNIPGSEVFQQDVDLFQVLDDLGAALQADDAPAIRTGLDDLQVSLQGVISARSDLGVRLGLADRAAISLEDRSLSGEMQLSQQVDADLLHSITDLRQQEQALEAALGAASRIIQPSLLDFLR